MIKTALGVIATALLVGIGMFAGPYVTGTYHVGGAGATTVQTTDPTSIVVTPTTVKATPFIGGDWTP